MTADKSIPPDHELLLENATEVLRQNDKGSYTVPAPDLYPHQWLWDSCFIAIGLRHLDIERAQKEILSLLRGQWANGMLPNMILSPTGRLFSHSSIWRSWLNPNAPADIPTSGITQPPMLAEAVVRVGQKLTLPERRRWYKQVYPALLSYHQWLYKDRDPHNEGLVLLVHPWETGLDNTPPWMHEIMDHQMPLWISAIKTLRLEWLINLFRRDAQLVPAHQRLRALDAAVFFSVQRRLRRKRYDIRRILKRSLFAIEDVNFNAIFIRANQHLQDIAKTINKELPESLLESMQKTEAAFADLWDPYSGQYYSREFVTHRLLKDSTLGTLMPLYAGCINKDRAKQLVKLLEDEKQFGTTYPVPSASVSSEWFKPEGYWQGPTWVNTNWLIIDGLRRYGFDDHADALTESTLEMVSRSGCYEYFNPLDGSPAGAANFSWTAALTIDLIKAESKK